MQISVSQARTAQANSVNEACLGLVASCVHLKNKGYSNVQIAHRLGINESTVRTLLR